MKRPVVTLPNYVIGPDAYDTAGKILSKHGKTAVIVGGKRAMAAAADLIKTALAAHGVTVADNVWFGGSPTYENVDMLAKTPAVVNADMILAVGGGKCCDTCKVLSEKLGKPLFTFPTISSNCAPCTALAIMYYTDGSFRENYYSARPPLFVFINDELIANAPVAYLQAGIGDALSKEPEVLLALRNVPLDQNLLVGKSLCAACTEPLLTYGREAIKACNDKKSNDALQETILAIVISTGLVSNMTVCPEFYYNTNLAHCFYYGATIFPNAHEHLHGFWVAYGVLVLLDYDGQTALRDRVLAFCRDIGLPVTLADIGLSEQQLDALAEKATKVPGWHIDGYDLSKDRFKQAILNVDALGRKAG